VRIPSDAQAAFLSKLAEREEAGDTIEWNATPDRESSTAALMVERVDRVKNTSRFDPVWAIQVRNVTLAACLKYGWLNDLHRRAVRVKQSRGEPRERLWDLRQLDFTEDGIIALGVWRERRLNAPPEPLPTLTDREREIVELAARAIELGYALAPRKPARAEARRMRDAGWFRQYGIANHVLGLAPTPMAIVEIRPDQADIVQTEGGIA